MILTKSSGSPERLRTFGLYIHIPYCVKKCPYCDFNSYGIEKNSFPEEEYTEALLEELKHSTTKHAWSGQSCCSIFFGGGTPSLFSPSSIAKLTETASRLFSLTKNCEITLEANPGTLQESLGEEKLKGFLQAGVNRISIGAQSFSQEKLTALGRIHSPEDTLQAISNIKTAGFKNFNIDLMYGILGEKTEQTETDIQTACSLEPNHLSAYALTIEPGTEFFRMERAGKLITVKEELHSEMYDLTRLLLLENGFQQYEISNFSRPGFRCQHNLGYWNGENYLGIGAGAHSFSRKIGENYGERSSNIPGPSHYISRIQESGEATQKKESLTQEQAEIEFFYLGLRKSEGILKTDYEKIFRVPLEERYYSVISELSDSGLIALSEDSIFLTPAGFLFSDSVFQAFANGT